MQEENKNLFEGTSKPQSAAFFPLFSLWDVLQSESAQMQVSFLAEFLKFTCFNWGSGREDWTKLEKRRITEEWGGLWGCFPRWNVKYGHRLWLDLISGALFTKYTKQELMQGVGCRALINMWGLALFIKHHLCTAPVWFISHKSLSKVMGNIGASVSLTMTLLIGIAGCLELLSLFEYMEVWIRGMNWPVRGRQAALQDRLHIQSSWFHLSSWPLKSLQTYITEIFNMSFFFHFLNKFFHYHNYLYNYG